MQDVCYSDGLIMKAFMKESHYKRSSQGKNRVLKMKGGKKGTL